MKAWQKFKLGFHLRYSAWLLQGLSRIVFWSDKFKQRFSYLGAGLAAALLITLIFGANVRISSIYQLFALLLALIIFSLLMVWLQSKWLRRDFKLRRILPQYVTVGVPARYKLEVSNQGRSTIYDMNITEIMGLPKPSLVEFLNSTEPDEDSRNWYDRHTGFYRFVWWQRVKRGADIASIQVKQLQAGETQVYSMNFTALRRGYIHLPKLRLRIPEPLALAYVFYDVQQADSLLALPKAYRLPEHLAMGGKRTYQQGGVSAASHVGESEEFNRLREYREGDSPRHLYWPSLAKPTKPLIKEYQDEFFTRAALVVDNCADVSCADLLEDVVSVAAGFALAVDKQEILLDMLFTGVDKHSQHQLAGRAVAHEQALLENLATMNLVHARFTSISQAVLMQAQRLSGCVLILLAWDESRQALVQQLEALNIPVRIFLISEDKNNTPKQANMTVLRVGNIQADLDAMP
ncbi:MAG: DUF58 domain-containing protein [Ghiorsea sp.]|nr:DUF58 domain-containing protein [Ghiorsea sp.]